MSLHLMAVAVLVSAPQGAQATVPELTMARYLVRVDNHSVGLMHIKANLHLTDGRLRMTDFGAWGFPEGWSTFVTHIQAVDAAGDSVAITHSGRNTWSVSGAVESVRITYTLDFREVLSSPWPDGPRTIGVHATENDLYLFTGSLFIMGADGSAEISFDLPSGWRATTPWSTFAGHDRYLVGDRDALTNNAVVLGSSPALRMPVNGDSLRIVGLHELNSEAADLVPVARSALSYYERVLGSHGPTNYLVVLFEDSIDSGEAFRNTFVLANARRASRHEHLFSGVAHETLHFWNGQSIRPADWPGSQWFQEGFTEYVADLFLLRRGWITKDAFLDRAEKHTSFYLLFKGGAPFERISLVEAGADKAGNQPAIYDGGWLVAFALDLLLRELSGGHTGVEDVLARMFEDLGPIATYTNEDVVRYASEVARSDQSEFFSRFVFGTAVLPLRELFSQAGLHSVFRGQQVHLVPDEDASTERRCVSRAWLQGAPSC